MYNEKLLKDTGVEVPIMVQNVFMYIDSILCGGFVLAFRGELTSAFTLKALTQVTFSLFFQYKKQQGQILIIMYCYGLQGAQYFFYYHTILKTTYYFKKEVKYMLRFH